MDAKSTVAWNLRRLRVAKDISQDDLALSADIERSYVGHLERGKKNPTVETLEKLAQALGCQISEFFQKPPEGAQTLAPLNGGRRAK